ncbi:RICIN domain-containing protein [Streptomyces sp. A7024]|uniref:RICIN domain-containing protein n=1 Tax=Streptomyces coryli TaxID=1128680 RepID=A0A6G4TZU6_9ACTN|nr:RICIN domain-containing protein [Streptomyces coryli]NGN64648.1 RICIN domain-containing protein [Streptomyces coryli]
MSQGHARPRRSRRGPVAAVVAVAVLAGAAGWAFTSGPLAGDDGAAKKPAAAEKVRTKDGKSGAKKTTKKAKAKDKGAPKPPLMTTAPRTGTHKAARAAADDWPGSYGPATQLKSGYSWLCLDGGYDRNDETWAQGNPGDVVYQFPCAKRQGAPDQNWRLKTVKPGLYQLRNSYSGNCIAATSVTPDGWGAAELATCARKKNQLWRFTTVEQTGEGPRGYFSSYAHPDSALNLEGKAKVPGGKISLWQHDGPPQEWIVNTAAL